MRYLLLALCILLQHSAKADTILLRRGEALGAGCESFHLADRRAFLRIFTNEAELFLPCPPTMKVRSTPPALEEREASFVVSISPELVGFFYNVNHIPGSDHWSVALLDGPGSVIGNYHIWKFRPARRGKRSLR